MVTTRPVTPEDIDLVCRHREEMFRASNAPGRTEDILKTMTAAFRLWLAPRLADNSYFGVIAEEAGVPVGGIGLMVIDWPPHPSHAQQDRRGYVLNVFVEPSHRKRGIARMLMGLGDSELRRRGVSYATLHATRMGVPMYEKLGWAQTREMARTFD